MADDDEFAYFLPRGIEDDDYGTAFDPMEPAGAATGGSGNDGVTREERVDSGAGSDTNTGAAGVSGGAFHHAYSRTLAPVPSWQANATQPVHSSAAQQAALLSVLQQTQHARLMQASAYGAPAVATSSTGNSTADSLLAAYYSQPAANATHSGSSFYPQQQQAQVQQSPSHASIGGGAEVSGSHPNLNLQQMQFFQQLQLYQQQLLQQQQQQQQQSLGTAGSHYTKAPSAYAEQQHSLQQPDASLVDALPGVRVSSGGTVGAAPGSSGAAGPAGARRRPLPHNSHATVTIVQKPVSEAAPAPSTQTKSVTVTNNSTSGGSNTASSTHAPPTAAAVLSASSWGAGHSAVSALQSHASSANDTAGVKSHTSQRHAAPVSVVASTKTENWPKAASITPTAATVVKAASGRAEEKAPVLSKSEQRKAAQAAAKATAASSAKLAGKQQSTSTAARVSGPPAATIRHIAGPEPTPLSASELSTLPAHHRKGAAGELKSSPPAGAVVVSSSASGKGGATHRHEAHKFVLPGPPVLQSGNDFTLLAADESEEEEEEEEEQEEPVQDETEDRTEPAAPAAVEAVPSSKAERNAAKQARKHESRAALEAEQAKERALALAQRDAEEAAEEAAALAAVAAAEEAERIAIAAAEAAAEAEAAAAESEEEGADSDASDDDTADDSSQAAEAEEAEDSASSASSSEAEADDHEEDAASADSDLASVSPPPMAVSPTTGLPVSPILRRADAPANHTRRVSFFSAPTKKQLAAQRAREQPWLAAQGKNAAGTDAAAASSASASLEGEGESIASYPVESVSGAVKRRGKKGKQGKQVAPTAAAASRSNDATAASDDAGRKDSAEPDQVMESPSKHASPLLPTAMLQSALLSLSTFYAAHLASRSRGWRTRAFNVASYLLGVLLGFVWTCLCLVARLHRHALSVLSSDPALAFACLFLYALPFVVRHMSYWAPPWAASCLWFAFLAQALCTSGPRWLVALARVVVPLLFLTEGVSYHVLLLELNGAERIVLAFALGAFRTREYSRPLFLAALAIQVLTSLFVGTHALTQWIICIASLLLIHEPETGFLSASSSTHVKAKNIAAIAGTGAADSTAAGSASGGAALDVANSAAQALLGAAPAAAASWMSSVLGSTGMGGAFNRRTRAKASVQKARRTGRF